ncbi:Crotonobetainyl-CoA:carnitine CoA-transferase CaiB [Agromyces sp. CF514]|uniref:CaiB/BaiF CoA transferase family protein n=1 Tax=Agromyces sp. CF514 TaxID=1881031 RepID=UPI0008E8C8C9|nr:CaiB/BaiF CoA-transferase family protein [Agromyces sp. CF514]SFR90864.1 Crotonobetainyl-CoA:carnitine CoA-transferase CaiB [Agromyces sp. CF514]
MNTHQREAGPLGGIRVIELGQYISGPYAAKLLADLGADVVKVEAPEGDPMRRWEGSGAMSPQFAAYNRGKRAVTLDLKTAEGLAALLELARTADVLIENFRPGVATRLGFGPEALRALNPRLITCSITGFGADGPYAKRPAYDTVISAVGAMYSQVVPAETLRPLGPAFSDLLSGMSASQAVLAALHARDARDARDRAGDGGGAGTGEGEHVEVSMVGSLIDFLTEAASTYLETGQVAGPDSRPRRAQAYACVGSDGRAFVIHMSVPEKFWVGLVEVLETPSLASDPRFSTREARVRNYDELDVELKAITERMPRQHWLDRLAAADIPHGPLNTVADLFDDPQIASMGLVEEIVGHDGDPLRVPAPSTRFHRSGRPELCAAPRLGADNGAVLGGEGDARWGDAERSAEASGHPAPVTEGTPA